MTTMSSFCSKAAVLIIGYILLVITVHYLLTIFYIKCFPQCLSQQSSILQRVSVRLIHVKAEFMTDITPWPLTLESDIKSNHMEGF